MKNIFAVILLALIATAVNAREIKGTLVLKGQLKKELTINGKKSTCKVKIEKINNLAYEDSDGYPGYSVATKIEINGGAKFEQTYNMINIFQVGNNRLETRDLEYQATGASMIINEEGGIVKVTFQAKDQTITCAF